MTLIVGRTVNIEDLDEATAIIVFGRPVYDAWKLSQNDQFPDVVVRVKAINQETGTITLEVEK